jgi:hypothetical protein
MEAQCEYCREAIAKGARKCKVCGEPFYFTGKALKVAPLMSIVMTILSLGLAYFGVNATKKAGDLQAKELAAHQALRDMAEKLPEPKSREIINDIRINDSTFSKIEKEARKDPRNIELQRKLFIYRAIKRPN